MRLGLAIAALLGTLATAQTAAGQEAQSTRFHIVADYGVSVQDGFNGVGFGRDMVSYGLRLTADWSRFNPWIDAARFTRPGFECVAGLDCNDAGWLARAGASAPLAGDRRTAGLNAEARTGVGAGFTNDTSLSYLVGLTLLWRGIPRIAPGVEFRWEHVAGLNLTMLAAGISIDL